jgi:hypothetical protein
MRYSTRFPSLMLAVSALAVSACGSETVETPVDINSSRGSLEFAVSPSTIEWGTADLAGQPPVRTVLISGLVAAIGYPIFGTTQYSGGFAEAVNPARGWFTMSTSPVFSREPLGWRFTFRLNPSVAAQLTTSAEAVIPVTIPAARNNPQMITVRLNLRRNIPVSGDLVPGAQLPVVLTNNTTRFSGGSDPSEESNGNKYAIAFRMVLQPGQSTYIRHTANFDAYLYVWEEPASPSTFVGSNDDSCGSLNSQIFVQNTSGTPKTYLVYGSHFSSLRTGTGNIFLTNSACGSPLITLQSDEAQDPTLEAAMRAEYNAKYGIKE